MVVRTKYLCIALVVVLLLACIVSALLISNDEVLPEYQTAQVFNALPNTEYTVLQSGEAVPSRDAQRGAFIEKVRATLADDPIPAQPLEVDRIEDEPHTFGDISDEGIPSTAATNETAQNDSIEELIPE